MKVLVADDDDVSRRLLELALRRSGHEVFLAKDGDEALAALLAADAPRLAILDWMMPGMEGVEVCRRVRAAAHDTYVYLILLTSKDAVGDAVAGLDAGADDFLRKPFDTDELEGKLRTGRRIVELYSELVAAREGFRALAIIDPLTGIPNRRGIIETLEGALARAQRTQEPVSVAIADLDRFKQVNDRHGHAAGDAVLRECAQRLRSGLRRYDAVGRYGGEEFLVVWPGVGAAVAREMGERLRARLAGEPVVAGDLHLAVTCSLGVATSTDRSLDSRQLLAAADAALYRAKERGRNCVESAATITDEEPSRSRS